MTPMERQDDSRPLVDTVDPGATDQPAEGGRPMDRSKGPGHGEIVERGPRPDLLTSDDADPGAYVGREPEGQAETIPGGVTERDERVSAHDSRRDDVNEPEAETHGSWPEGHRGGDQAGDDDVREAGQNR